MKKTIVLIITIITLLFECTEGQSWQWARHMGSVNDDVGGSLCADTSGNIYMVGDFFMPNGIFGNDTIGTIGLQDIFITKLDGNGNFVWSKRGGSFDPSSSRDEANDILFDSLNNSIIITGTMNGTNEIIDSCHLGSGDKLFLNKMDLNGNCIWAKGEALLGNSSGIRITTDSYGSIYMVGYNRYLSYFDGNPIQPGGFIAKFQSSDGSLIWVKKVLNEGGYFGDVLFLNNELFIAGASGIDSLHLDTTFISCNNRDVFISRFDTAGNLLWVKTMGGPNNDDGGALSLDAYGNIFVTGSFQDTAYFDSFMLTNGVNKDWFIAKCNINGNISWVNQLHVSGTIYDGFISTDKNGYSYGIGTFAGDATFGNFTVTSSTANDMFVTRYDSSGNCLGVRHVGNAYHGGILSDVNGSVFVSGSFSNTTTFDSNSLMSYGSYDTFIAKHDAITNIDTLTRVANNQLLIYANPTAGKCNITVPEEFLHAKKLTLSIFDNTGKLIQQKTLEMNEGKIKVSLEAEAKGVYNVTLSNGSKSYGGKIVFE